MKEFETAQAAARQAGEILRDYYQRELKIEHKEGEGAYNLVSEADLEAERVVVDRIKQDFPGHAILGEELHKDDVNAPDLWIIDPLDGTNNFLHRVPHFAVSIAYYRDGQPQCGVIYNPIREDWYEVIRGQGATHNGRSARVAEHEQLAEAMIAVGFYYDRGAMMEATLNAVRDFFRQKIHGIRRFGTAALDLVQVGDGLWGGYFEFELSPWDFAVGKLYVEEAGGKVTTCGGATLPLAKTSIVASNEKLHEAMLEVIYPHWTPHAKASQDE